MHVLKVLKSPMIVSSTTVTVSVTMAMTMTMTTTLLWCIILSLVTHSASFKLSNSRLFTGLSRSDPSSVTIGDQSWCRSTGSLRDGPLSLGFKRTSSRHLEVEGACRLTTSLSNSQKNNADCGSSGVMTGNDPHYMKCLDLALRYAQAALPALLFTCFSPQVGWASTPTATSAFEEVSTIVKENFFDSTYNHQDLARLRLEYLGKVERGSNENKAIEMFLATLGDKYTRYLDKEHFEALWKYDAIGIGVIFETNPGKQMVVASQPIDGSSAAKAGMKKGDLVFAINQKPTATMTAVSLLEQMSNDESDNILIEFSGPLPESEHRVERLKRSTQKASNPVSFESYRIPDGRVVGNIKLREFNAKAVSGMEEALAVLRGSDVIVLDLRGNTGGGFQFALNIGGMFMDNKDMVVAVGQSGDKNTFKTSYPPGALYKGELVVVTDGLSASASEVLAGGLKDNCRAVIAGQTSFGKGKIQAVFGLSNGSGMTMTVAQYVTPKGTIIQGNGLHPDLPLPLSNAYVNLMVGDALPKLQLEAAEIEKADALARSCNPE